MGLADDPRGQPRDKIHQLFLAGMARKGNEQEMAVASKLYVARKNDMLAALQDIWWAVLNSNEFILNH